MKNKNNLAKAFLLVGILSFLTFCTIIGAFDINVTNTCSAYIFIVTIYIFFAISGYIYTAQEHIKHLKRYYAIRILLLFYAIVIVVLGIKSLF